ncbi:hypothetical protein HY251_20490 [bacterium]|nr:hypothetical protein [bacterium]
MQEDKTAVGIHGEGVLQAKDANLVRVPFLLGTLPLIVTKAARGESALDPTSFDRIYTKLSLTPQEVIVDVIRLDSATLTLGGKSGKLWWNGDADMELVPFKTGSLFDDIFKQFDGVRVTGKIWKPNVDQLQISRFRSLWESVKRAIFGDD